jgi:hypothetical protein
MPIKTIPISEFNILYFNKSFIYYTIIRVLKRPGNGSCINIKNQNLKRFKIIFVTKLIKVV